MKRIRLVQPSEQFLESYYNACIESHGVQPTISSFHNPANFDQWRHTIFQYYTENAMGINLPPHYVPSTTYWLVEDDQYIGSGNIRHYLSDTLRQYGGHIGYMIRASRWNQGYGTLLLKLLLEKAQTWGIEEALITCNANNIASARVMEKNGARRIDSAWIQTDEEYREIYRYLISTDQSVTS